MENAQRLLYIWIKEAGEVSYELVNKACSYLDVKFNFSFEKPTLNLFYPLLYNGVIDFSGNGKFCVTPKCIITKSKNKHIIVNSEIIDSSSCMVSVGIQVSESVELITCENRYNFNLEFILTQMPTVESCILTFQEIYNVKASDFIKNKGVSKKKNDSHRYYFLDPKRKKCYTIPHQSINPDAINIAACYERILDSEYNGVYDTTCKQLKLKVYRIPILIYRVLMIESLFSGKMPYIDNGCYVFSNISNKAYLELNRVLCKSIKLTK